MKYNDFADGEIKLVYGKISDIPINKLIERSNARNYSKFTEIITNDDGTKGYELFGNNDMIISRKKGYYDVIMHGENDRVKFIDTETGYKELSEIVKSRKDYKGQNIRLLSCSTGKEDNDGKCFAQCLPNELGVEVEAPNDIIHAFSVGRYTIGLGPYDNTGK